MRRAVRCRWELNPARPPYRTSVAGAVGWVQDADSGRHGVWLTPCAFHGARGARRGVEVWHRRTCGTGTGEHLFLGPVSDDVTIGIRWEVRCDPSQHRDQFEVSAIGA